MSNILFVLRAGVETGFLSERFIDEWAENIISQISCPQVWLVDLIEAKTQPQIEDALRAQMFEEGLMAGDYYDRLLVGFYHLRLTRGEIDLSEYHSALLDLSDPYCIDGIHPETMYAIMDEQPISPEDYNAYLNFRKYGKECEGYYKYLISPGFIEKEAKMFEA